MKLGRKVWLIWKTLLERMVTGFDQTDLHVCMKISIKTNKIKERKRKESHYFWV